MVTSGDIIGELGALSYAGIWVTSLLANIIIPVPEEIVLLALGYLAGTGKVNIFLLIPIVISGLLVSDLIMYSLSRRGSRVITWFYKKFFAKRIAKKGDRWMNMNIKNIIIFSRFLVQLRFLGPFIAGQRKLNIRTFIIYDLFALILYVSLYLFLGMFFHSKVQFIIDKIGVVRNIILIAVSIIIVWALFKFVYRLLLRKNTENTIQ